MTMLSHGYTLPTAAFALVLVYCGPDPGSDAGAGGEDAGAGRDAGMRVDGGPTCTVVTFYRDADGDGAGDPTSAIDACVAPDGYVASADDCNDRCADCRLGAPEVCGSERDEDCDGATDESDCETCVASCAWSCAGTGCNDASMVSAGGFHACALRDTGTAVCWGEGEKLGSGARSDSALPVAVVRVSGAVQLAAGWSHSCARFADATLACWGSNSTGALGLGGDDGTYGALSPMVVPDLGAVRDVAVGGLTGGSFTCAATNAGVSCFGSNSHGQLGNGGSSLQRSPVAVSGLLGPVARIAAGGEHACALLEDGRVQCWGANGSGQLGIGSRDDSLVAAAAISGLTATTIALGDAHTCALDASGTAWCWGANDAGQLGRSDTGSETPAQVDGLTATTLSAGGSTTCAIDAAGQAWCWGLNEQGQVGDGTTDDRAAPTVVSGLADAREIDVGSSVVCARRADASVACWGEGASGQLGNGSTTLSTVPVSVGRP